MVADKTVLFGGEITMTTAERIKEKRLALGLTQEELGEKLGLQKSAIAKYENGRVENIKKSVLLKMAEELNCSLSYLMGLEEEENKPCEIGKRIKNRREELKITQEELAYKVGYKSRSSINKIEIDGRGLPQSKIVAFANALETTPAYLVGWENKESKHCAIGERIKKLRCEKMHMSQVLFADKINVSKQTLYKYENNIITNIPSDKIESIASLCNVSPAYLMGWENDDVHAITEMYQALPNDKKQTIKQIIEDYYIAFSTQEEMVRKK